MERLNASAFVFVSFALVLVLPLGTVAQTAVPMLINYQGELRSLTTGQPVPDGSYDMVFKIYDVQSGGTKLWQGTHSSGNGNPVPITNGTFSVILGSGTGNALDASLFDGADRWLETAIGTETLSPRQQMTSVAYSIASENSRLLGGKEASEFANSTHAHSGTDIISGIVSEARIDPAITRDTEKDAAITTHAAIPNAHHARYTDAEAVAAMGAESPNNPLNHDKTTKFSELTDMAAEGQIPGSIARDTEIMPTVLANDGTGSLLDADKLDGLESATLEESAEIDADIAAHKAIPDAHHVKTTKFSELTDMAAEGQIPGSIARDTEIMPAVLANDGTGSGLDADKLDGMEGTALEESAEIDSDIATHGAIADAHHAKTTKFSELTDMAAEGQIPGSIARDTEVMPTVLANDGTGSGLDADKLDGAEAAALEESAEIDSDIAAHKAIADAHHARYTNAEAVAAMGAKADSNPLNHDKTTSLPWGSITDIPAGFDDGVDNDSGAASWLLAGNTGTSGTNFLGTTDSQALELRVNNGRALRLEPNATSPNLIGGHSGNSASAGVVGAAIGGGGESGYRNRVTDNYGTVAGGEANQAGDDAGTTTDASYATVGGGVANTASGYYTTVGGGYLNGASGYYATVSGGYVNSASGQYATLAGGNGNAASAELATVGGGTGNNASGYYTTVGGGVGNSATTYYATVGGGGYNQANASYATIAGGGPSDPGNPYTSSNRVTDSYGTIGGGGYNQAGNNAGTTTDASYATVGGGVGNTASGYYTTVGGGLSNSAIGSCATVAGGNGNAASAEWATVGGGDSNNASALFATVGGGWSNQANASYATIAGGGPSDPVFPDTTRNLITDDYGTIGGGGGNQAGDNNGMTGDATYATVAGGAENTASGAHYATVGGGWANTASGGCATVGGGRVNAASGPYATVGGGSANSASFFWATVGGGEANEASDQYGTVGGGGENTASGDYATIGGGMENTASSWYATVPGGSHNQAIGDSSFAAGRRAIANGAGSFVWGDSNDLDLHAWGDNQFVARATGGFWFITSIDAAGIPVEGMMLPAGSSHWVAIGSTAAQLSPEQSDPIQELEAENTSLKQRIDELESRLAALEALMQSRGGDQQ